MGFLRYTGFLLLVVLLTVLTQVGGLVLLICQPQFGMIERQLRSWWFSLLAELALFILVYALVSFIIVPFVAEKFGRVPLPWQTSADYPVQPANVLTCLLNRHYVRPELRGTILSVAQKMNEQFPGSEIVYLDANFPFFNGFPLLPHISHTDGKKLDLAFFYRNTSTKERVNGTVPSWLGYGICEEPAGNEVNTALECEQKGYKYYSLLQQLMPKEDISSFALDKERTAKLIRLLAAQQKIDKLFLEPHLKTRWGLSNVNKIRFHGCQSVRHDDHIHVQTE